MRRYIAMVFILSGCSDINEYVYSGKENVPFIKEHVVQMPNPPSGFNFGFNYWESEVFKTVEVTNPTNKEVTLTVSCNYVQFSGDNELTVKPHKTRAILVKTLAKYAYDKLCWISE